jgi:hypothetical protein
MTKQLAHQRLTFSAGDNSWKNASWIPMAEPHFHDGSLYYYLVTHDGLTNYFISVASSTDEVNFTIPTNYILEGYSIVYVTSYNGVFHMLAQDSGTLLWDYIPGSSPTTFDQNKKVTLDLENMINTGSGWDSVEYKLRSNLLRIAGIESMNDKLYIFYMAGDMDFPGSAPNNGARGIGYLTVDLK